MFCDDTALQGKKDVPSSQRHPTQGRIKKKKKEVDYSMKRTLIITQTALMMTGHTISIDLILFIFCDVFKSRLFGMTD